MVHILVTRSHPPLDTDPFHQGRVYSMFGLRQRQMVLFLARSHPNIRTGLNQYAEKFNLKVKYSVIFESFIFTHLDHEDPVEFLRFADMVLCLQLPHIFPIKRGYNQFGIFETAANSFAEVPFFSTHHTWCSTPSAHVLSWHTASPKSFKTSHWLPWQGPWLRISKQSI